MYSIIHSSCGFYNNVVPVKRNALYTTYFIKTKIRVPHEKKIIQNIKVRIEIQLLVNYLSINLSPRTIARETKQNKTENYVSNSR